MREADPVPLAGYLLDVEGTTTPVDFVYRTLFPYARRYLPGFLASRGDEKDIRADIAALRMEWSAEAGDRVDLPGWDPGDPVAAAVRYAGWLMDRDRKSTALKSLQGKVWQAGYLGGELRGEVFDDVEPAFRRWKTGGQAIRIFSSGSVLAQRLLFQYSTAGDLRGYIDGYFDTKIGAKTEPGSYKRIAAAAGVSPDALLFVSDSAPELEAASNAGWRVALSLRETDSPAPEPERPPYRVISTFTQLT